MDFDGSEKSHSSKSRRIRERKSLSLSLVVPGDGTSGASGVVGGKPFARPALVHLARSIARDSLPGNLCRCSRTNRSSKRRWLRCCRSFRWFLSPVWTLALSLLLVLVGLSELEQLLLVAMTSFRLCCFAFVFQIVPYGIAIPVPGGWHLNIGRYRCCLPVL